MNWYSTYNQLYPQSFGIEQKRQALAPTMTTMAPTMAPTLPPWAQNKPALVEVRRTDAPTSAPTRFRPTMAPTMWPTEAPTEEPTWALPTDAPTMWPTTESPTEEPTEFPTYNPTDAPSYSPTGAPTEEPPQAQPVMVVGPTGAPIPGVVFVPTLVDSGSPINAAPIAVPTYGTWEQPSNILTYGLMAGSAATLLGLGYAAWRKSQNAVQAEGFNMPPIDDMNSFARWMGSPVRWGYRGGENYETDVEKAAGSMIELDDLDRWDVEDALNDIKMT